MKARLTFLGTGTSQGVPIIGCKCAVCQSIDQHDKRFRSAALVEYGGQTILVDAGPDFRMQMLRQGVSHWMRYCSRTATGTILVDWMMSGH